MESQKNQIIKFQLFKTYSIEKLWLNSVYKLLKDMHSASCRKWIVHEPTYDTVNTATAPYLILPGKFYFIPCSKSYNGTHCPHYIWHADTSSLICWIIVKSFSENADFEYCFQAGVFNKNCTRIFWCNDVADHVNYVFIFGSAHSLVWDNCQSLTGIIFIHLPMLYIFVDSTFPRHNYIRRYIVIWIFFSSLL